MNYNRIAKDINKDINSITNKGEVLNLKNKIHSNMSEAGAYGNRFNNINQNYSV